MSPTRSPRAERARQDYIGRINRVIDAINARLAEKLSLEDLAAVACFSPYHFHRVFRGIVGESLYNFILRLRIEKAANLLLQSPDLPVTDIAFDCGFSSSSHFASSFKARYGVSASEFRALGPGELSKILKPESKIMEVFDCSSPYGVGQTAVTHSERRFMEMKVEVKEMPGLHVAYARHIGKYEECGKAWETVCSWAGRRGLMGRGTQMIGICHDNPDVTPEDKCRYDACVTVPAGTKVEGEIGQADIPSGRYAVLRYEGSIDAIGSAYDWFFAQWLPESGFQVDDRPCYDIYLKDPDDTPERKTIADICMPVKAL